MIQQYHFWVFIQELYQYLSHTLMFIAALFAIAKLRKQTKYPSMDKWIKTAWYMHKMEYYSPLKRRKPYHM